MWEMFGVFESAYETCLGFDSGDFMAQVWSTVDFWPFYLGLVFIGVSVHHNEMFFWILTTAIFVDWVINFGLRVAVGASDNIQPESCIEETRQMPALGTQSLTMLWTLAFGLVMVIYPRSVTSLKAGGFVASMQIMVYSRIYLVFSTPAQLIAGATIGFLMGVVFLGIVAVMRYLGIDKAIIAAPAIWLFPGVSDTIMYPDTPTLMFPHRPKNANIKVYEGENYDDVVTSE